MKNNEKCIGKRTNSDIHFMLGNYALVEGALAGAKAMTATASTGFNYMQEGI